MAHSLVVRCRSRCMHGSGLNDIDDFPFFCSLRRWSLLKPNISGTHTIGTYSTSIPLTIQRPVRSQAGTYSRYDGFRSPSFLSLRADTPLDSYFFLVGVCGEHPVVTRRAPCLRQHTRPDVRTYISTHTYETSVHDFETTGDRHSTTPDRNTRQPRALAPRKTRVFHYVRIFFLYSLTRSFPPRKNTPKTQKLNLIVPQTSLLLQLPRTLYIHLCNAEPTCRCYSLGYVYMLPAVLYSS